MAISRIEEEIQGIYEKISVENNESIDLTKDDKDFEWLKDDVNSNLSTALDRANNVFQERIFMLKNKIEDEIGYLCSKYPDYSDDTKFALKCFCFELKGIIEGSEL